jgi:Zn-dependent M28 family amino/carboxypeptidase
MRSPLLFVLALTSLAAGHVAPLRAENRAGALDRLTKDVTYLASEELEGRGVGTKGLQTAADFLRDEFKRIGLASGAPDGSYFQEFELTYETKLAEGNAVTLRGPDGKVLELEMGKQFQPLAVGGTGTIKAPIVFAGYAIKFDNPHGGADAKPVYDDFAGVDVKGKVIVVLRKEPQQDDEESDFDGKKTTSHSYILTKVQQAKEHGAAGILFVNDPATSRKEEGKDELAAPSAFGWNDVGVPFVHVSQKTIDELLAASPLKAGDESLASLEAAEKRIDSNAEPISQPLAGWTAEITTNFDRQTDTVENVIGVLEGAGPLADETVIVGAHYDHLGMGPYGSRAKGDEKTKLHNGADDNATGTAAVLEIARRFAETGERPRRRVVFIAFGGEERGLLGSAHYVKNPLFPLENTVAMINFDMIGRLRENKVTVFGSGTSPGFDKLLDRVNETHGFSLAKNASGSGGSDQASFVGKKIPVMFFFTGTTKEYHTPDDDVETLNLPGLAKVVDFADDVTREIVSADERPAYAAVSGGAARGGQMAYLGVNPDYNADVLGLRLNGTTDGSPAARAGLKEGDVIVQFGTVPVADIQGLAEGLRKYKAGDKVKVTYKRGPEKLDTEVTLEAPKAAG